MPFGPHFPFVPADSDGIDDQDGLPNDWFVPANPGAVGPNNLNMPAPNSPVPNPQPSAAPLGPSNQPAPPRPDPFQAFWALIPASRVGALAWAPPIFPSSNPFASQNIPAPPPPFSLNSRALLPPAGPTQFDDLPPAAANGLFGNSIGRMLAARAKPYDPFEAAANGMWGGIAKMIAANAAPDPASRGFLGSLADLPVPPSTQAASYAPYSGPFLPLDPAGIQAGSPFSDIILAAADTPKIPPKLATFDQRAVGKTPPLGSAAPRLLPPLGSGPRPPAPPSLAPPPASAPQLPPPQESSLPRGALPSPSPGQGANSPRPSDTPVEPQSVTPPSPQSGNESESRLNLPFGMGARTVCRRTNPGWSREKAEPGATGPNQRKRC
jgi:hypothetical protein